MHCGADQDIEVGLDDVGAAGRDRGRGATYLLLPPDYDGPLLPGALVYRQRTHAGFTVLRPIIADASPENVAKAVAFARKITCLISIKSPSWPGNTSRN